MNPLEARAAERGKPRKVERAAALLERSRAGVVARRLPLWRGALVLNYHRMGDASGTELDPGLFSATAEELDAQLGQLARDFDIVPPSELVERPDARGRRVLITFDDGYRDNHELALPVLRRHGAVATFFVVPGFIDRPRLGWWDEIAWMVRQAPADAIEIPEHGIDRLELSDGAARIEASDVLTGRYKELPGDKTAAFLELVAERSGSGRAPEALARDLWMTWDQVRELRDAGMVIGGHTLNHPVLGRLPRDQQAAEIDGCARRLHEELGVEMRTFSYPVGLAGSYDDDTRELLRAAGTEIAFEFRGGYQRGAVTDLLAVPRAAVSHHISAERFAAMLALPQAFAGW